MLQEMEKLGGQMINDEAVNKFFDAIEHINQCINIARGHSGTLHLDPQAVEINSRNQTNTQNTMRQSTITSFFQANNTNSIDSGRISALTSNTSQRTSKQKPAANVHATRPNKLNIFTQNAHSIRGKADEIRLATISCPFDVIMLTETWLNDSISNNEHFSSRFNVYRCDRSALTSELSDGGGVLIAIDATLHSERIILPDSDQLEHVCVKVEIGTSRIILFAVYIRSMHEADKFMLFSEIVRNIQFNENDTVIVCGDFNQPGIEWTMADDGDYYLPMNISSESEIAVCDTMLDLGMHQMCNLENQAGNVLDLVFTNQFYELLVSESTRPLIQLDQWHKAIEIELDIEYEQPTLSEPIQKYEFHLANYDAINDFFERSVNLQLLNESNNIHDSFNSFYATLHDAVEKFVPKKITKRNNDPPWYNRALK